jgi:hypothetical protein
LITSVRISPITRGEDFRAEECVRESPNIMDGFVRRVRADFETRHDDGPEPVAGSPNDDRFKIFGLIVDVNSLDKGPARILAVLRC